MLVVANFKMNGNKNFYLKLNKIYNNLKLKGTKIVLCPPFVYLNYLNIKNANVFVGSQDISSCINNNSTGQISPIMLKEFGVSYCIVGHAERRKIGEADEFIAQKVKCACENNIIPIICVGEELQNNASSTIKAQLKQALKYVNSGNNIIIAYEPVWAIGTGKACTVKQINARVNTIKKELNKLCFNAPILYGGSVKENNFSQLKTANVDGFLVGGLSLETNKFCNLIEGC